MAEFLYVCRWTGYFGLSKIRAFFVCEICDLHPVFLLLASLLAGGKYMLNRMVLSKCELMQMKEPL